MHTPICELDLELEGTLLGGCIDRVIERVRELDIRTLTPTFYLSDGYGCVEGTTHIGVGFWDAHPLLREIRRDVDELLRDERDLMLLVAHEVGHAFCYAHKLYRLKEFRALFRVEGNFFRTYPNDNDYRPDPFSGDFVNPDGDHYAQKHPDDDFAETFATYIDAESGWRERYRGKPGALKKLHYVGRLIRAYGGREPLVSGADQPLHVPIAAIKQTVAEFLRITPRRYARGAEGFLDPELLQIFSRPGRLKSETAPLTKLVARSRRFIVAAVERRGRRLEPNIAALLLDKIEQRARSLSLVYRQRAEARALAELLALVLVKARDFQHFHTFRNVD